MADTLVRFDGDAVWATLPPEHQAAIGAAALEFVVAGNLADRIHEDGDLLGAVYRNLPEWQQDTIADLLREAFVAAVPRDLVDPGDRPAVPSLLGQLCRACGCSSDNACRTAAGPCRWVEPDLCSGCAAAGEAPHA